MSSCDSSSLSRASRDLSILDIRVHRDSSRFTIFSKSPANTKGSASQSLTHSRSTSWEIAFFCNRQISYRWTCCTCPSRWSYSVPALVTRCSPPVPGVSSAPHTEPPSPVAELPNWGSEHHTAQPGGQEEKCKNILWLHWLERRK